MQNYHENNDYRKYVSILFEDKFPGNFRVIQKPDMEKMTNMILYFAKKLSPTETMINKLLFFSYFYNYKKLFNP